MVLKIWPLLPESELIDNDVISTPPHTISDLEYPEALVSTIVVGSVSVDLNAWILSSDARAYHH